ncbi:MAG: ATP-binding protein [Thermofilaceae archaeon]
MSESFARAWMKRRAQFSVVCFLKSSDPKRVEQFFRFIHGVYSLQGKPFRIYHYIPWRGLRQVVVSDGVVGYAPVEVAVGGPLGAAGPRSRVRDLQAALNFLEGEFEKGENVVAVFSPAAPFKSATDGELALFSRFLWSAIMSEEYYPKNHFIVVFSEAPEALVDADTLAASIVVDVPRSTVEEREQLLRDIAERLGVSVDGVRMLAEATQGLNLHETESVALESLYRFGRFDVSAMVAYKNDIVRKKGLLEVDEGGHGFEAVGGYGALKEYVMENIVEVLREPERAQRLGVRPPRGILLFGPPGTGKTWFARALAKELQVPFLRLRSENIVSMWYGETTRRMAEALRLAEAAAPCILFIDEIDRFGRRGGFSEHEESRRAFSVLLEWLGDERRKTIVIGTTNRPQDLDEAFIRVGRFDYIIPVLFPDEQAREEILRVHTSVVRRVPLEGVNLRAVARATELWTGAELEELVERAARHALRRKADAVTEEDFSYALGSFKIQRELRLKQLQEYLSLAVKFTNDARFLEQLKSSFPA